MFCVFFVAADWDSFQFMQEGENVSGKKDKLQVPFDFLKDS